MKFLIILDRVLDSEDGVWQGFKIINTLLF